jgi:hypothetical protein
MGNKNEGMFSEEIFPGKHPCLGEKLAYGKDRKSLDGRKQEL